MSWNYGFFDYKPVHQKKSEAEKALANLKKKNPDVQPIVITGKKLATTWWGIAWNRNLESYADFENRLSRGRSYVRNGAVLDLSINAGKICALVYGSSNNPYRVEIAIDSLSQTQWAEITKTCAHRIESISQLAEGAFPKDLEEVFLKRSNALFPSPKEIHFQCSCPDYASLCKHVAAVLYGVGTRFDEDATLFFTLRDVDIGALLKKSVQEKMSSLLKNADSKSDRILEGANIRNLFGLEEY